MIRFGPFDFDAAAGLVYQGAEETLLPPKPAGVLGLLVERSGQLVTKDDLLETVWAGSYVTESSLTDAISLLRQVLGDDSRNPTYIQTLHRRGYRFIADVETRTSERAPLGAEEFPGGAPGADRAVPSPEEAGPGLPLVRPRSEGELAAGARVGDYEIISTLGAGAMGVVYRARDPSLEREVAIKILRQSSADDQERGARLEREAKLVAGVSHPNIAAIHSLDDADGIKFAVLELVEGETLEARLRTGRLGVEQALKIGAQIASALEAAHGNGVIHRDLKPANIKLNPVGQIKVLDFGLAQALEVSVFGGDADQSPTASLTIKGTGRGSIVGTVAYMSPEQARGQDLGRQADIWSFGCVLYELLSGRRAFGGETITDTLAAVVDREPDWEALPSDTPFLARALLRRCLQKDPARRLHDIADARIEIEEALERGPGDPVHAEQEGGAGDMEPAAGHPTIVKVGVALALGAVVGAVATWYAMLLTLNPEPRFVAAVEWGLRLSGGHRREGDGRSFQRPSGTAMALSPDGENLVYIGTAVASVGADGDDARQLYRSSVDRERATPMEGTEGASNPFFSPDGRWVGFVAGGQLKKVSLEGGDPLTVFSDVDEAVGESSEGTVFGASWGDDGTIVLAARRGGLLSGPSAGGTLAPLTTLDAERRERSHRLPHMLPGGEAVLFTSLVIEGDWERAEITAYSLRTGERTTLIVDGSDARYLPSGHLVFARDGTLMAVGFDPQRLEISGEPVMVIDGLLHSINHGQYFLDTGTAHFTTSDTGTLIYARGGAYPEVLMSPLRVDFDGRPTPFSLPQARYLNLRLSPDGTQLVYTRGPGRKLDVWTFDIQREVQEKRVTAGFNNSYAIWSPDGEWIAFGSDRDGPVRNLYVMAADGSGEPRRLTTSDRDQMISSWSVDGTVAFLEDGDIWVLDDALESDSEPRAFFESPFGERAPTFSPDGRWLAYTTGQSGRQEVHVRPYPGPDPPTAITGGGGLGEPYGPAWSPDGRSLYFRRNRTGGLFVTEMGYGAGLEPGDTTLVFARPFSGWSEVRSYDVDPAGGFVMISPDRAVPQPVTQLTVVRDWFEELGERVPAGR